MVSLLWFCTSPLIIGRGERNLNSIVTDFVFLVTALLISYNVHCKAEQTRIKQKWIGICFSFIVGFMLHGVMVPFKSKIFIQFGRGRSDERAQSLGTRLARAPTGNDSTLVVRWRSAAVCKCMLFVRKLSRVQFVPSRDAWSAKLDSLCAHPPRIMSEKLVGRFKNYIIHQEQLLKGVATWWC